MAAVILAAGASTRLGEPKQLAMLGEESLLERAVRVAAEAGCAPIVVVLGCEAPRMEAECRLEGARIVLNPDWREGMAASIRSGVAALDADGVRGAVLMTCDQPAVTASHLRKLMSLKPEGVVASAYAGRRGVPAYFPAHCFEELRLLKGDAGARDQLASALAIELARGELDVDTRESLEAARTIYGHSSLCGEADVG